MENDLRFTLLENGLDFIRSGLESLQGTPAKHDLKYAVIHLCAGIELVLKERLQREHWSLVFDKVEKADKKSCETSDFISVYFEDCLQRLIGICGVHVTDAQRQELLAFRRKRNRLEHFGIVDSVEALTATAAEVLGFLLEFINNELHPEEFPEEERAALDGIRQMLPGFTAFVETRWKAIKREVESAQGTVTSCPRCTQEAAIIDDGIKCQFCRHESGAEQTAEEYVRDILGLSYYRTMKDGSPWPIYECPECGRESLVDRGPSGSQYPHEQFICFGCGEKWMEKDLGYCSECQQPHDASGESLICDSCLEAKVRSD